MTAAHDHQDCQNILAAVYEFLDGELPDERRARVQAHLEECLPCFEAFDFEAEIQIVVSTRCREQVPEGVRARVLAILEQDGGAGRSRPPA